MQQLHGLAGLDLDAFRNAAGFVVHHHPRAIGASFQPVGLARQGEGSQRFRQRDFRLHRCQWPALFEPIEQRWNRGLKFRPPDQRQRARAQLRFEYRLRDLLQPGVRLLAIGWGHWRFKRRRQTFHGLRVALQNAMHMTAVIRAIGVLVRRLFGAQSQQVLCVETIRTVEQGLMRAGAEGIRQQILRGGRRGPVQWLRRDRFLPLDFHRRASSQSRQFGIAQIEAAGFSLKFQRLDPGAELRRFLRRLGRVRNQDVRRGFQHAAQPRQSQRLPLRPPRQSQLDAHRLIEERLCRWRAGQRVAAGAGQNQRVAAQAVRLLQGQQTHGSTPGFGHKGFGFYRAIEQRTELMPVEHQRVALKRRLQLFQQRD